MPGRFITSSTIPMSCITFNSNRPSIQESLLSSTHALSSSEAHFGIEISTPAEEPGVRELAVDNIPQSPIQTCSQTGIMVTLLSRFT